MPSNNPAGAGTFNETSGGVGDKISDAASEAKQKVSDLGRSAADKIDQNRGSAASGLESAANTLREKAGSLPGGENVTNLANNAAEKLTTTADYVRTHDVNGMMADLERLVKNNPGPSLVAAAAVGFLLGRTFTSND